MKKFLYELLGSVICILPTQFTLYLLKKQKIEYKKRI